MSCNCRSVDECTHKFRDISQDEINEWIREDMRRRGLIPNMEWERESGKGVSGNEQSNEQSKANLSNRSENH